MVQSPDTFFGVAWHAVRAAAEADLKERPCDPERAVMQRCFDWDVGGGALGDRAEVPDDLLRLYYHLLRENERLPTTEQLGMDDIRLVRETLLGTVAAAADLKALVDRLFKLVQAKIEAGRITQAWLVLQMFEYERSVRLWNERNLYLEEMTLRFGERRAPRREAVAPPDLGSLPLVDAVESLAEETGVRWMALGVDSGEVDHWRALYQASGSGIEVTHSTVGRKWRPTHKDRSRTSDDLAADASAADALRSAGMAHIKATYFLLLVSNQTGWEPFLPKLFGWILELTEGTGVTLFSELHRMVTMEECTVREAFEAAYAEHLEAPLTRRMATLGPDDVAAARDRLQARVAGADLGEIAAGSYSFTGMLLDEALGIAYPQAELAWHIHRLL